MAPAPPDHPVYQRIDCSNIENPFRICKDTSCCNSERDTGQYCRDIYDEYPDPMIGSICWYCCSVPKEVGPPLVRKLRGNSTISLSITEQDQEALLAILEETDTEELDSGVDIPLSTEEHAKLGSIPVDESIGEGDEEGENNEEDIDADARIRTLKVSPDDLTITDDEDDEEYFDDLKRRYLKEENDDPQQQRRHLNNYDHVPYFSYQWMLEVKTEYYFRYEGTMAVPPCYDQVHYRVMKDPILVNPAQITELERLLAQRRAPRTASNGCQVDTAGRTRPGHSTNDVVDVNRPLQSFHKLHRKVFCECKNWKSKFTEDRQWCRRNMYNRFYFHPYNFGSVGFEV